MAQEAPSFRSQNASTASFASFPAAGPPLADLSFCNSFWANSNLYRNLGATGGDLEKGGFEPVKDRMKSGRTTMEELRAVLKARKGWTSVRGEQQPQRALDERTRSSTDSLLRGSKLEFEYSKRLSKISQLPIGTVDGETGEMAHATTQVRMKSEHSSQVHADLGSFLQHEEQRLGEFSARYEVQRKTLKRAVEKAWRAKSDLESLFVKTQKKYEAAALAVPKLLVKFHESTGTKRGRIGKKHIEMSNTLCSSREDHLKCITALARSAATWNVLWKDHCDASQDLEEDRLEHLKSTLLNCANAVATASLFESENAVNNCDANTDVQTFIAGRRTGSDIPDAPIFVDVAANPQAQLRNTTFQRASFVRSSRRGVRAVFQEGEEDAQAPQYRGSLDGGNEVGDEVELEEGVENHDVPPPYSWV